MRSRLIPVFVIITGVMTFCTSEKKPGWVPGENPLFTTWGEALDHADPWPEYPRPAMERKEWMSLNGLWDYASIGKDADRPAPQGRILVPFPVESALSGVKARMTDSLALWYSREFVIPRTWKEKQIVLNFEASDWETTIWVDDNLAAIHRGGYDPFWCNITPYLSDRKKHTLVVKVTDPTDRGRQPRGKQVLKPGGIW